MSYKNENYAYAGHVNGLCKFIHMDNAHEENRNYANKLVYPQPSPQPFFKYNIPIPAALLENTITTTQFFENDCAFPWLSMMTASAADGGAGPVRKDIAELYGCLYGELAEYEYMRATGSKLLFSFVPRSEFGYNDTKPDLWVPCYVAVDNYMLPAERINHEHKLSI